MNTFSGRSIVTYLLLQNISFVVTQGAWLIDYDKTSVGLLKIFISISTGEYKAEVRGHASIAVASISFFTIHMKFEEEKKNTWWQFYGLVEHERWNDCNAQ